MNSTDQVLATSTNSTSMDTEDNRINKWIFRHISFNIRQNPSTFKGNYSLHHKQAKLMVHSLQGFQVFISPNCWLLQIILHSNAKLEVVDTLMCIRYIVWMCFWKKILFGSRRKKKILFIFCIILRKYILNGPNLVALLNA